MRPIDTTLREKQCVGWFLRGRSTVQICEGYYIRINETAEHTETAEPQLSEEQIRLGTARIWQTTVRQAARRGAIVYIRTLMMSTGKANGMHQHQQEMYQKEEHQAERKSSANRCSKNYRFARRTCLARWPTTSCNEGHEGALKHMSETHDTRGIRHTETIINSV